MSRIHAVLASGGAGEGRGQRVLAVKAPGAPGPVELQGTRGYALFSHVASVTLKSL